MGDEGLRTAPKAPLPFSHGEKVAGVAGRMRVLDESVLRTRTLTLNPAPVGEDAPHRETRMKTLKVGEITITSLIERDGPWRTPETMFPAYNPEIGRRHLAELDPIVFDPASGRMVITYQTFLVRTPRHTILIDTCTGEDKGYLAPYDFPKQPWLDKCRGLAPGGHHARLLHPPAFRPHWLEYDAQ
jgi:hypothetical protein